MRLTGTVLLILVYLFTLAPALPANAQVVCGGLPAVDWRETRTRSFTILYPAGEEGTVLSALPGEALDAEYDRFQALFEASLSLPLSIRFYPTVSHYYCLNAQPPDLPPGGTHSHVGEREIAVITANLQDLSAWLASSTNIFRYELAILFASQIAGTGAPPGLLAGVGHYAQDPVQSIGPLQLSRTDWQEPTENWRKLWETPEKEFDFRGRLQATSTVAFLVDGWGWDPFLKFLKSLPTSGSYTQSLKQVYAEDFAQLQKGWQEYYPRYFGGRWRANILYNYDLSPYQQLLESGEYVEAGKGLQEVIPLLEKINQAGQLRQARLLLEIAHTGQQADSAVAQSQAALQAGEYERALDLVGQAQGNFSRIGHFHRMDELNAYRDQLHKIQALHAELERMRAKIAAGRSSFSLASQLLALDGRLGRLGDAQGQIKARDLAGELLNRQHERQLLIGLAVAAAALGLLGLRIWLLRRQPGPEALL